MGRVASGLLKVSRVYLGVSGFGSERILRTLQDSGWGYRPKFVIWTYFMNDPWNANKLLSWWASDHPNMLVWEKQLRRVRERAAQSSSVKSDWHASLKQTVVSYEFLTWWLKNLAQPDSEGVQLCRLDGDIDLVFGFKHLRNWVDTSNPEYVEELAAPKELVYWHLLTDAKLDITEQRLQKPYADMADLCDELSLRCLNLVSILRKYAEIRVQLYFR